MAADDRFDLTESLLARIQDGDPEALDRLVAQVVLMLEPPADRMRLTERDTEERRALVRGVVLDVIGQSPGVELRAPGGLLAYLLQAATHRLADDARRRARRENSASSGHGPLWQMPPLERDAIIARIERRQTRRQQPVLSRASTIDAARTALHRALRRLGRRGPKRPV